MTYKLYYLRKNKMNVDQLKEAFSKLLELHSRILQDVTTHKQMLIRIVLDTLDSKSRLESIRTILLESQLVTKTEDPVSISAALSEMPGMTISQMETLTEMMIKIIEPSINYRALLNKIGDVINSNYSDDEKIDRIGNLLV
jgi:hypothetical protein